MSSKLYNVFVYGTLKKGEPNHHWFQKGNNGFFRYVGEAKTTEKYPLIIGTRYNIPFVLYSPGNGKYVTGELYEVDGNVLANLDVLEDHPKFYVREEIDFECLNGSGRVKAWIYFIKKFQAGLLNGDTFESYSSKGDHGLKYVERYLRGTDADYKREILA